MHKLKSHQLDTGVTVPTGNGIYQQPRGPPDSLQSFTLPPLFPREAQADLTD